MVHTHTIYILTEFSSSNTMSNHASPENDSFHTPPGTPPPYLFPFSQVHDNPPHNLPPAFTPQELWQYFQVHDNPPPPTPPQDLFPSFQVHDNPPPAIPPEVMFPEINQPMIRQLTEDEQYELDMEVLREHEAEQARQNMEREAYLKEKRDRRNRRAERRWARGLPPVPSSEDDSSASYSSHEGYVSDDSFN